ncbi:MAG: hypothetical protein KBF37_03775 [Saprospiraceae bacterium]|jgi:shikimate kinase|nr:hypothetical protein [Saprospiraceae bacterium]MBV6471863.1 Shikimate kinase [Saprospiraceae bacterium]
MRLQRVLSLVGMPGSGKTAFARAIGERWGFAMTDLDELVESQCGTSLGSLSSLYGERQFRALERFCLLNVLSGSPVVLSTGGGTPAHFDNMNHLLGSSAVIYIERNTDWVSRQLVVRPRAFLDHDLSPGDLTAKLFANRQGQYARAHLTLHADCPDHKRLDAVEEFCRKFAIIAD